jgi:hypothetical protein
MELIHKGMKSLKIIGLNKNSINENGYPITLTAYNATVTSVTTLKNTNR